MTHHELIQRVLAEKVVSVEAERDTRELQLGDSICEVHNLKEKIKGLEEQIKELEAVSVGERGLLNHLFPEFRWRKKQADIDECGCGTTRYTGIDPHGEKDDKLVVVEFDCQGNSSIEG